MMKNYLALGAELNEAMKDLHQIHVSPSAEQLIRNRNAPACSQSAVSRFKAAMQAMEQNDPPSPLRSVTINDVSAASAWRLLLKMARRTSDLLGIAAGLPGDFDEGLRKLLRSGPGWKPAAFEQLQSELECQLERTPAFNENDFTCDSRLLTQKVVEQVYGHSTSSLHNWRTKGCSKLGGRHIITSSAYGPELVYLHGDLLLIKHNS